MPRLPIQLIVVVGLAFGTLASLAADPAAPLTPKAQSVKATFLITGLHCPPCTTTVEQSIKSLRGVRSVKVDWKSKNARVEFDEHQIAAQQIAGRIAATPHMMGGDMQYRGALALKVPSIATAGTAEKATQVLTKVKGVSKVYVYNQQQSVGVAFSAGGTVTSKQLIDALATAGIDASVLP